jgi:hypothetical protein
MGVVMLESASLAIGMFPPSNSYRKLDEENVKDQEIILKKKSQKRGKKFKSEEAKPLLSENEGEDLVEEELIEEKYIEQREDDTKREIEGMKQIEEEIIGIVQKENDENEVIHENQNQSPIASPNPSEAVTIESQASEPTSGGDKSAEQLKEEDDSHALVLLYKSDTETLKSDERQTDSNSNETPCGCDENTTIEDKPVSHPAAPSKPPKPQKKSTNPFAEEEGSYPSAAPFPAKTLQKSKSLNPFDDDTEGPPVATSSSNPFSPDYAPPPTSVSTGRKTSKTLNQMKTSQSLKSRSTNPFDSDNTPPATAPSTTASPAPAPPPTLRSPNLFKSQSSLSSVGTPPQSPSCRPSLTRFSEQSPEYPDLVTLLQLGFLPSQAYHALQTHKDLQMALQSLRTDLLTALVQKTSPNWYPPVLTRIGSWMPSQANSSSRVLYYIKVQLNHSDIAYVVTKRFSEFVDFYYRVSPFFQRNCQPLPTSASSSSQSVNPNTVLIPFVDDRISGYLWGTSEELCNRRQDMLHKWLSFLCLSERMMTDLTIHKLVMEFFQIDNFVQRVPALTGIPERPLTLQ